MAKRAGLTTTADLIEDPHNRRTHGPRNIAMIASSLREVGPARSIVLDEHDQVLAGNGVLKGAAEAGITKVRIVEGDADTIIAVRRRGLTAEQKRALAIYDNRTAELAEWSAPQLAADQLHAADLTPFFTDAELARLLKKRSAPADVVPAGDDTAPGQYLVLITCADEAEQVRLLERFTTEGIACKALVS